MAGGWDFAGPPVRLGGGIITLEEGSSFCLSDRAGDIAPDQPQGLFFRDTRILSGWQLRLDDERMRFVGAGMREDIVLRNYNREPVGCTLSLLAEADFADLFEVKEGRVRHRGHHSTEHRDGELRLARRRGGQSRGLRVLTEGAVSAANTLNFHVVVPARGVWRTRVLLCPVVDGVEISPSFALERPLDQSGPAIRARQWRE